MRFSRSLLTLASLALLDACGDRHPLGGHAPDAAIAEKAGDSAHQRAWIGDRETLAMGEYFHSANRQFYAILTKKGTLEVRKGSQPDDDFGLLWSSPTPTRPAVFNLKQDRAGALLIANGSGPSFTGYVWRSIPDHARDPYFTLLRDDGNLCTYKGSKPARGDVSIWCSGPTAVVTWMADGYRIVSEEGDFPGRPMYWGFFHGRTNGPDYKPEANQTEGHKGMFVIPTKSVGQRWKFLPDSTWHLTSQPGMCMRWFDAIGWIRVTKCDATHYTHGWYYQASDHTIRNRFKGGNCLEYAMSADFSDMQPWFSQFDCLSNRPAVEPTSSGNNYYLILHRLQEHWRLER